MANKISTNVSDVFSNWARNGKSDSMAQNHSFSVRQMLNYLPESDFTFLDIGCGNGWVCREVAKLSNCISVTGIDVARDMIELAQNRKTTEKESYFAGEFMTVDLQKNQDVVFAMESLYYMSDLEKNLTTIKSIINPGGRLIFGCDYHTGNPQTEGWAEQLGVNMHFLSSDDWKNLFIQAGFRISESRYCKDPDNPEVWHKEEMGTLIIVAEV